MGKRHSAQVRKTYLLGVHNDTNVSVSMHTMDLAYMSAFYELKSVRCSQYAVHLSTRGYLCGLSLEALADESKKSFHFVAKSATLLEEVRLTVKKGESIRRAVVAYSDTAITGLELSTETQKVVIGDIDNSEYRAEADYFEAKAAIIGFDVCFGADRVVELSLFLAPLQRNDGLEKLTKPYLNGSSFALVDEEFYRLMKQQQQTLAKMDSIPEGEGHRKLKSI